MSNTWGKLFRITSFGESHGPGIGIVIDGCPAGITWDSAYIEKQLQRRKPGQNKLTTQRKEEDIPQVLSGIFEGKTTGTPITLWIPNENAKPQDYEHLKDVFRPSHADFTWWKKYAIRDFRGGGRASARVTAGWVAAGAVAELVLQTYTSIQIRAWVEQLGPIKLPPLDCIPSREVIDSSALRCPEAETSKQMEAFLQAIRKNGDTVGGVIYGCASGVPAGLGEPLFDKFSARLAQAMFSINAVKGFEIGMGFAGACRKGSEVNDIMSYEHGRFFTLSNYSGGIQGGITNGELIYFRVAFKPVATILKEQPGVDKEGKPVIIKGRGRHDPCVLPRAVPIIEAMTALVVTDFLLLDKARKGC
ncbi:MAG: chorismate synthase [Bacteroidia bacterium]|nr:chorismate synthase [Bacteroidia bacterium]MDW8158107.1 chorismate synthase [Bacteroidia bacterium]